MFVAALGWFVWNQLLPKEFLQSISGLESFANVVAVVETVERDVRQRPVEETGWYRAEPQTEILRGDAVYSGVESKSRVQMKSGGVLELGEETLVIFDDVDGVTIPDVSRGQVKLKINGQMKVAISGEVTEFSGAQSELVLNSIGGSRNIRVVSGNTSITRPGVAKRSMSAGETFELPKSNSKSSARVVAPAATDVVSKSSISLKRKVEKRPETVRETVSKADRDVVRETAAELAPPIKPEPAVSMVETAPPPAAPAMVKEALSVADPVLQINRVMKVQEVYQRRGASLLVPRRGLKYLKVPVSLSWNGAADEDRVFIQVSKESSFRQPWLERDTRGPNVVIEQWKTGKNFWRVSRDGQTWSLGGEVVVKPIVSISQAPIVRVLNDKVSVYPKGQRPEAQAKLKFEDNGLSKVRGWVLQGSSSIDFPPQKSKTVLVSKARIDVPLNRPGRYFFRVRSVAEAGDISTFSSPVEVQATRAVAPQVPLAPRLAKRPVEKVRDVAAVDANLASEPRPEQFESERPAARTSSKLKTNVEARDPNRARPWQIAIEGGETALVSSEQLGASADLASVHMVGLRGGYYEASHSALLAYRTQFGASNSEGNSQSSSKFEARYTRWWTSPWQSVRLGWLGGYDRYRNSGSTRFSKGYEVAKTGLDVGVSFTDKWKGGGNFQLGGWTDSNRIYEVGGFLSYEFSRELAFGIGYRLGLFEAGSAASAAQALPYREAMGEAYSSLQFSF